MATPDDSDMVERVPHLPGLNGIHQTIDTMAKMALGPYGAGSMKIRNQALQIVRAAKVPENDKIGELQAIHAWVQQHLRYVFDPQHWELLTYPETLLARADGDCDDHVILEAALLGSLGFPTRFITLKNSTDASGLPHHVFMAAMVNNEWIMLDPIVKNKPAGWAPIDDPPYNGNEKFLTVYPPNSPDGVATPFHISGEFLVGIFAGYVVGRIVHNRITQG